MKEQLQRIGVECPELEFGKGSGQLERYSDTLERLVATLAERVYEAEKVQCHASMNTCEPGTGRRQA